jgi:hypothetical protein
MRARLLVLVLLALPSCAKFEKKRECRTLAQKVNGFINESKSAGSPNDADPQLAARESRTLAERYRKLSQELGALNVRSDELAPHAAGYRKLAEQAATALEGAAIALERRDLELARTRRNDFDQAARAEGPLVGAINAACSK